MCYVGSMVPTSIIERFEAGAIPQGTFDHASHVELVWSYLDRYSLLESLDRVSHALATFATNAGHAEKYHHTITWAFCFLVHDRRRPGEDFETFAAANRDLFEDGRRLLAAYYSREVLDSDRARASFVWPDRVSAR